MRATNHVDIQRGTLRFYPDDLILDFIALYQAWGKSEEMQRYQALLEQNRQGLATAD
jgi:hypothetical protein